jgi:hypothetical protein
MQMENSRWGYLHFHSTLKTSFQLRDVMLLRGVIFIPAHPVYIVNSYVSAGHACCWQESSEALLGCPMPEDIERVERTRKEISQGKLCSSKRTDIAAHCTVAELTKKQTRTRSRDFTILPLIQRLNKRRDNDDRRRE